MRKLLAIEWDQHEARLILARVRRGQPVLTEIVRAPLLSRDEDADDDTPPTVPLGEQLKTLVSELKPGRAKVLMGISRLAIDLRPLALPPCPDDALPDMVRDEALNQLGPSSETSLIDFVPLTDDEDEPRTVIAASLSQEQFNSAMELCRAAGLKPARMIARPYATGSLLSRTRSGDAPLLVVDVANGELDLTVVAGGAVVFSRTVRMGDPNTLLQQVVNEIRRTLVGAQNQPPGYRVAEIVLCGDSRSNADLANDLHQEFKLPVEVFDPLEGVALDDELAGLLPKDRGRLASLIGMLQDEAQSVRPAIDFLNPKRAPAPERQRRRMMSIAAGVVGLVLAVGGWLAWGSFSAVNDEIEQLTEQSHDLDGLVKRAQEEQTAVNTISEWQAGDVVWLDELRDLSTRFPLRRDAVLLRLTLGRAPGGGGLMELQGLVRDPSIVGRLENQLRDDHHEVRSKRVQENIQEKTFTWQFESSLSVSPRSKEQYQGAVAEGEQKQRTRGEEEYRTQGPPHVAREPAESGDRAADNESETPMKPRRGSQSP